MDEPESLGAITLAAREKLDNLIFVVNCNLQRLDGPVRGNGKIIQELEADFRGAGWNVIKVIWGSRLGPAARRRRRRPARPADGRGGGRRVPEVRGVERRLHPRALLRQVPGALAAWSAHLSDEQLRQLRRGGHDPKKVYAAYKAAVEHRGAPTVILARTIKGYGLGEAGEGQQHHPPAEEAQRGGAARVPHPLRHPDLRRGGRRGAASTGPPEDSPEMRYLRERRQALGGYVPSPRRVRCAPAGAACRTSCSRSSPRARTGARSPPPWSSSAS